MNKYVAFISLCVVISVFVPWYRRRRLCEHSLLAQILPGRFRDLEAYLKETEETSPCEEFWHLSRGLSGILSRLRDMVLILRLLQHQIRAGRISTSDARHVWHKAAEQLWFSFMAVPESAVCALWSRLPHANGLFALRSHYEVAVWAYTVCSDEDAELQLNQLL